MRNRELKTTKKLEEGVENKEKKNVEDEKE